MITAIIMASGLSSRMGENKLLLNYNNKPIIEYVFKAVKKSNFNEVIVVSQYNEIEKLSKEYKFKYIHNENANTGQSESIKLGTLNSKKSDGYMFFVGDQPFIDIKHIETMIKTFNENKEYIIIPRYKNKSGNPVIFPYNKINELLNLKNDEKGKKVITKTSKIKYVDVSENMLFDIDTKEDYKKLGVGNEKS
ncbi:molybdenum cofactor cytidylyltransferase [Romboutsia sp.]|uniref:molybdenum cofactor cytidylyltransferase n=1 Tax=Romboutsia sp. TaxID=1965302 RepID=UPI002BC660C3|nr:molybdenum cofactor cytidylyltransferase [Romboutsia sp.]HSQ90338.1 molybdenum cofactor cytidylyltransferase [Romboutsia sp.]